MRKGIQSKYDENGRPKKKSILSKFLKLENIDRPVRPDDLFMRRDEKVTSEDYLSQYEPLKELNLSAEEREKFEKEFYNENIRMAEEFADGYRENTDTLKSYFKFVKVAFPLAIVLGYFFILYFTL